MTDFQATGSVTFEIENLDQIGDDLQAEGERSLGSMTVSTGSSSSGLRAGRQRRQMRSLSQNSAEQVSELAQQTDWLEKIFEELDGGNLGGGGGGGGGSGSDLAETAAASAIGRKILPSPGGGSGGGKGGTLGGKGILGRIAGGATTLALTDQLINPGRRTSDSADEVPGEGTPNPIFDALGIGKEDITDADLTGALDGIAGDASGALAGALGGGEGDNTLQVSGEMTSSNVAEGLEPSDSDVFDGVDFEEAKQRGGIGTESIRSVGNSSRASDPNIIQPGDQRARTPSDVSGATNDVTVNADITVGSGSGNNLGRELDQKLQNLKSEILREVTNNDAVSSISSTLQDSFDTNFR